jgi:hypothetical protein
MLGSGAGPASAGRASVLDVPAPTLEVHRGVAPVDWDRWVQTLDGGPFHCMSWAAYRASAPHKEPLFFAWRQPKSLTPLAVALAIETSLPRPLPARSIHFDAPPATVVNVEPLIPSVERWMNGQRRVTDAFLGSLDSRGGWAGGSGRATRFEFYVESADEDELLKRMGRSARWSIRRARRSGIEIETDSARMRDFVALHATMLDRLRRVKGVRLPLPDMDEFAQRLAKLRAEGVARLFLASVSGTPVAGALFSSFGRRAYYLVSGATDAGRERGVTASILHQAMSQFSSEGLRCINLGGVSPTADLPDDPDHGLYTFKLGMGGVPHRCADRRIIVRPGRCLLFDAARGARSALRERVAPRLLHA